MVTISREQIKNAVSPDFAQRREVSRRSGSVSGYAGELVSNIFPSALRYGGDIATAVFNPIQTAKTTYDLGKSVLSLLPGVPGDETLAREVGKFYVDRYGGLDNALATFRDDPVGAIADAALVIQGGAGVGRVATKPGTAARATAEKASELGKRLEPSTARVDLKGRTISTGGAGRKLSSLVGALGREGITPIQAATTGVKRQALDIARRVGDKDPDFAKGRKGVKESEYVADLEEGRKLYKKQMNDELDLAKAKVDLNAISVPPSAVSKIVGVYEDTLNARFSERGTTDVKEAFSRQEEIHLRRLGKRISDFSEKRNPTANDLQNMIKGFTDDFEFIAGKKPSKARARQVHADINNKITNILYGLPGAKSYGEAMRTWSKKKTDLSDIEKELSLDGSPSTQVNKIRASLRREDSISEEYLLGLPNGQRIFNKMAGELTKEYFPSEYLRIAQPGGIAGILQTPVGTIGGAAGGGFLLGGIGGALGGAGLGILGSALFQSPRVVSSLQSRFGAGTRKLQERLQDPRVRAAAGLIPATRPLGVIQEEVYEPLQRRGLL